MNQQPGQPSKSPAELRFFAAPADFRNWLAAHHATARELWVGCHRKEAGRASITWPESVDEALCFGWIDGIRKIVDAHSYKVRFTPRKLKSTWSAVNIARAQALQREGKMQPVGAAAFARRTENNSAVYSFENRKAALAAEQEREFQRHRAAWDFFLAQPPGYRRVAAWWLISAKQPQTQQKRLHRLIAESKAKRRIY